jgi:acetyl-CoA carboxylase carboxyltransferase component
VSAPDRSSRLRTLVAEYRELAGRISEGGGRAKVEKMHARGQLSPRERVAALHTTAIRARRQLPG